MLEYNRNAAQSPGGYIRRLCAGQILSCMDATPFALLHMPLGTELWLGSSFLSFSNESQLPPPPQPKTLMDLTTITPPLSSQMLLVCVLTQPSSFCTLFQVFPGGEGPRDKPTAMAQGRVAHLIEWKGWSKPKVMTLLLPWNQPFPPIPDLQ